MIELLALIVSIAFFALVLPSGRAVLRTASDMETIMRFHDELDTEELMLRKIVLAMYQFASAPLTSILAVRFKANRKDRRQFKTELDDLLNSLSIERRKQFHDLIVVAIKVGMQRNFLVWIIFKIVLLFTDIRDFRPKAILFRPQAHGY